MEGKKSAVKEKFAHEEYPIHIICRHINITDAIKDYAVQKLKKIDHFGGRVVDATITLDIQKLMHSVDFIVTVNNIKIKVSGRTENIYSAIDQAIDHLKTKLRRYHRKIAAHHAKGIKAVQMNVNVVESPVPLIDEINDQIEEENLQRIEKVNAHPVVSKETMPLKTLTKEEAVMKMELSGDSFMIYRSEEDQKLKVICRRDDGHYGIIETE